jgi:hypothetical protein
VLRNASEAALVRYALRKAKLSAMDAAQALKAAKHPSGDMLQAARAMLDSLVLRGILDLEHKDGSICYVATGSIRTFLRRLELDLAQLTTAQLVEEFGEYHGLHISPTHPVRVTMHSHRAARNDQTRALRQLWQCPSPWAYAQRIKDESND